MPPIKSKHTQPNNLLPEGFNAADADSGINDKTAVAIVAGTLAQMSDAR